MDKPNISVLIASYGPQSDRYLDLCYRSLTKQQIPHCDFFEVVHVSSGDYEPGKVALGEWFPDGECVGFDVIQHHSKKRLHFPAAIAKAYELSNKESDCIMLLNDDVILQKDCIGKMYDLAMKGPLIVNPRSNCDDNGRFYWSMSPFPSLQYRIEAMEKLFDQVVNYEAYHPFLVVKQPQVHFYATMMQRKIWDDVGGIDTRFLTGFDDTNFCVRAIKKGYQPVIAMHAYALHGSGVSADLYLTPEDRQFNEDLFREIHKV